MLGVRAGGRSRGSAVAHAFATRHLHRDCYIGAAYPNTPHLHGDPHPYRHQHTHHGLANPSSRGNGHCWARNATASLYPTSHPYAHRDTPPGQSDAERQVRWR